MRRWDVDETMRHETDFVDFISSSMSLWAMHEFVSFRHAQSCNQCSCHAVPCMHHIICSPVHLDLIPLDRSEHESRSSDEHLVHEKFEDFDDETWDREWLYSDRHKMRRHNGHERHEQFNHAVFTGLVWFRYYSTTSNRLAGNVIFAPIWLHRRDQHFFTDSSWQSSFSSDRSSLCFALEAASGRAPRSPASSTPSS